MEYVNGVSSLYIRKFARKLEQYNKPMQLPEYFGPMIGDKKQIRIAEVGAGPINTIGNLWPGVEVDLVASDVLRMEYDKLWEQHKATPVVPVIYADMEHLPWQDESFDIVHCVNAIDHTKDAKAALSELERICKKGGWVYLRHSSNQKMRFGGHHYWNIDWAYEDGRNVMTFDTGGLGEHFTVNKYDVDWVHDKDPPDNNKTIITAIWKKI